MDIIEQDINGVFLIKPKKIIDNRGYFTEKLKFERLFSVANLDYKFIQENESKSQYGVIRGLHYQFGLHEQAKLVTVNYGKIIDVVLDYRNSSSTYGRVITVNLDSESCNSLLIPRGCAHGFITCSETAVVNYKVDNYYSKANEDGYNILDDDLNINIPIKPADIIMTKKDLDLKKFKR